MKQKFIVGRLLLLAIIVLFVVKLNAQHFSPIDNVSVVKFTIKNFGINTSGTFSGLKGNIEFQPNNLLSSNFAVTIDAATIDTHIKTRDKHLQKEEYFDVAKYPLLSFTSTKIINGSSNGNFIMTGKLVIKGIAKEITFPFNARTQGNGYQSSGEFKLNRRDFDVGGKSMVLSDNLNVSLVVNAEKK